MIGIIHLHAGTGHKTASATTPFPPFSAVKNQKAFSLQKNNINKYYVYEIKYLPSF